MTTKSSSFEAFQKALEDLIREEGMEDFKSKYRVMMEVERTHSRLSNVETRPTVPFDIALTTYMYMLENECSTTEALGYAALTHGEDEQDILGRRHHPYYHAKKVFTQTKDHEVVLDMKDSGVLDRSSKKLLTQAKTLNSQLTGLEHLKMLTIRQRLLEDKVATHEERIASLEARMQTTESNIDAILQTMSTEDKVVFLIEEQGWKRKRVAQFLGKSERTIYRILGKEREKR